MKNLDEQKIHKEFYNEIFSVLAAEPYARHLGIELESLGPGTAAAKLKVKKHMLNAHNTVHGAILFALADYVFAAASNSYGKTAVGITTTMNFMAPAQEGEILRAEAVEEKRAHKLAWYNIKVTCEKTLLATMEATVYRKGNFFIPVEELKKEAESTSES